VIFAIKWVQFVASVSNLLKTRPAGKWFLDSFARGFHCLLAHVNAAANHHTAFFHGAQRCHDEWANRREDDGGVERCGRNLARISGPSGAESAREPLRFKVAGPREGINFAFLVTRDLRHDMRGRAEAVNADSFRVAGFDERTITNQSGAQQRRRLRIGIKLGQQKAIRRPGSTASKSWGIPDYRPTRVLPQSTGTDSPIANPERVAMRHCSRFDRTQCN
jgi:hypothetical protein